MVYSSGLVMDLRSNPRGQLRRYQIRPDGTARDSVMYSVLLKEWPAVGAGLRRRLNTLS